MDKVERKSGVSSVGVEAMRRYAAELVGTLALVIGGMGAAVLAGERIRSLGKRLMSQR